MRYRFWGDTETTAIVALIAQILEYAMIVESQTGVEAERADVKILLRATIKPDPGALAINKIDPYSDEWIMEAISEEKALRKLAELCKKYTIDNNKPILCAYNANFDREHLRVMFTRYQLKFDDYFHSEVFDPYSTVKRLVAEGVIKTKILTRKNGQQAPSCKLGDVAEALNLQDDKAAHRALSDTETLIRVAREVYRLATSGRSLYAAEPNPSAYKSGEVLGLIMDSQNGVRVKPVKILYNKSESGKVIVFDLLDYKKNGLFSSNIKMIEYGQIIDQTVVDEASQNEVESAYETDLDFIIEKAKKLESIA
jgi:DNA polymerase III epsilon subunit-like protein